MRRPRSWVSVDDPNVRLGASLCGRLLAGLSWERLVVLRELNRSRCTWMISNMFFKKAAKMVGMWTRLQKKVGSEDPASLLDQVYLGCTQRAARTNQRIDEKNRTLFESVVFAGIAHAPLGNEQSSTNTTSSSHDVEAHTKKRAKHYCR